MKSLALFLIYVGVSFAYKGESECLFAIKQMRQMTENSRIEAAILILWEQRNIGEQLISCGDQLERNPQLNSVVKIAEQKYQFSEAVNHTLQMLSAFRECAANNSVALLGRKHFIHFEEMSSNIGISSEHFFRVISEFNDRATGKQAPVTIEAKNLLIGSAEKMYIEAQSAVSKLLSYSEQNSYVFEAIKTFKEMSLMLSGVYKTLEMSNFGKKVKPLVANYDSILTEITFSMDIAENGCSTTDEEKRTKLFAQYALIKIFEQFRFKVAFKAIPYIASFLEKSSKATVANLELPASDTLNATCALFEQRLIQLKQLLADFKNDMQNETVPFEEFLLTFLEQIFSKNDHNLKLDEQFIDILKACRPSGDTKGMQTELEAIENQLGLIPCGALVSDPVYNIRHDYPKLVERINEEILHNRRHVVRLIRRLWYSLAKQLLVITGESEVSYKVKELLTDIIQQLQFRSTTTTLRKMPDHDGQLVVPIEFEVLKDFESSTKALVQLIYAKREQTIFTDSEMEKINEYTQGALYSIQSLLYQLKRNHIGKANDKKIEAIEIVNEVFTELQQSNSSLKHLIQPFFQDLQTISSVIDNLIKALVKTKRPIVQIVIDQIAGACDFADTADIVSYIVAFVNDVIRIPSSIDRESLNKTSEHLKRHTKTFKLLNDFADRMADENAQEPTQKEINLLLNEISSGNWRISVDYIKIRKHFLQIFNVLPVPSEENKSIFNLYMYISDKLFDYERLSDSSSIEEEEEEEKEQMKEIEMLDESEVNIALQRMQVNGRIRRIFIWLDSIEI